MPLLSRAQCFVALLLAGCSGCAVAAPVVDTSRPTVSSTSPSNGATGVALNATISATFSEAMTNSTLTGATFTLAATAGGGALAGSVAVTANTATLTPLAGLAAGVQYTTAVLTGFAAPVSLVEGTFLPADIADSNTANGSLSRSPNGTDNNNAASDWKFSLAPTPGAANG